MSEHHLLEVKELRTTFSSEKGPVTALDGVTFHVDYGETLGIVGESGCGKSVTAESIMRLLNEKTTKYAGEINFKGENLLTLSNEKMLDIRGNEISMIFQDAMTSLNPVYTIGDQIAEAIVIHQNLSKKAAFQKAIEMLKLTGIPSPEKRVYEYPHEISGGMRQRVMIAMALSCKPKLLIADEPTTALDVTIQAQILELMKDIQKKRDTSIIFITHDLGVVANVADRVAVMYAGQIVEYGTVNDIFYNPKHPYTWGLLGSMPDLKNNVKEELRTIPGSPPDLIHPPKGDAFAPRNEYAMAIDYEEEPPMFQVSDTHYAKTWLLHPSAPKIQVPDSISRRIEGYLKEAQGNGE